MSSPLGCYSSPSSDGIRFLLLGMLNSSIHPRAFALLETQIEDVDFFKYLAYTLRKVSDVLISEDAVNKFGIASLWPNDDAIAPDSADSATQLRELETSIREQYTDGADGLSHSILWDAACTGRLELFVKCAVALTKVHMISPVATMIVNTFATAHPVQRKRKRDDAEVEEEEEDDDEEEEEEEVAQPALQKRKILRPVPEWRKKKLGTHAVLGIIDDKLASVNMINSREVLDAVYEAFPNATEKSVSLAIKNAIYQAGKDGVKYTKGRDGKYWTISFTPGA